MDLAGMDEEHLLYYKSEHLPRGKLSLLPSPSSLAAATQLVYPFAFCMLLLSQQLQEVTQQVILSRTASPRLSTFSEVTSCQPMTDTIFPCKMLFLNCSISPAINTPLLLFKGIKRSYSLF